MMIMMLFGCAYGPLYHALYRSCEAYSTYPRTYDLLHAHTVFSDIEKKGCSGEDLLLEMDRILRPTGFEIIRDKHHVIDFVNNIYLHCIGRLWLQLIRPRILTSTGTKSFLSFKRNCG